MNEAQCVANSEKAKKEGLGKFKVGDKVIANNDCFCNEYGTVVEFETNMLGSPLIVVRLQRCETVFYAYELKKE